MFDGHKAGCAFVGMVHLLPLPGSHSWGGSMRSVLDRAMADAQLLLEGGCDAIIVENMGDAPYLPREVAPETLAAITLATARVVELGAPVGLQILAAANRQALGVAAVAGASFIRVEGFAYAHVADEGYIDACAGELLRARRHLGAEVAIWADVQKKHASHALTADLSIEDLSLGAGFCGADALVVTGAHTGKAANFSDIDGAARAGLPIAIGSGVTSQNAAEMAQRAQALIVGSWLKREGLWKNPVSLDRVKDIRDAIGARAEKECSP